MAGIQYAPDEINGGAGRGLRPMGGVPALNNPLPPPVQPKNGLAEAGDGDPSINVNQTPDALSDRYGTQPVPDSWPQ